MKRLLRRALPTALAATLFGLAVAWILQPSKTPPRPVGEPPLPVVSVLDVRPGRHVPRLHAWGRVLAEDALDLRVRVSGTLERLHPRLRAGAIVPAGEPLVEIDPTDYRLTVRQAEARLAKAQARLAIEGGKHKLARKELRMLQDRLQVDERSLPLTLREPQLREAQAEVAAARAELERARLDLERCRPRLGFDVLVLQRDRAAGELVDRGERIARLAPIDHFQVRLHLDPGSLSWLERGVDTITLRQGGHVYTARFERLERQLDDDTRQLRLIARIDDPLDRRGLHPQRPPLLLGSLVEADIALPPLDDVIALPREHLLENDRIWVVDANDRLRLRQVNLRFPGAHTVLIAPLPPGDRPLRGNPAGLIPGTRVETGAP